MYTLTYSDAYLFMYAHVGGKQTQTNTNKKTQYVFISLSFLFHTHAQSLPHTDPLKPHSALFNWTLEQRTAASGSC